MQQKARLRGLKKQRKFFSGKKYPLSPSDKRHNRELSSERVLNEHAIRKIKRFKIISDKYRNMVKSLFVMLAQSQPL